MTTFSEHALQWSKPEGRTALEWYVIDRTKIASIAPMGAMYIIFNLDHSRWHCGYRGTPASEHIISGTLPACIEAAERDDWKRSNKEKTT